MEQLAIAGEELPAGANGPAPVAGPQPSRVVALLWVILLVGAVLRLGLWMWFEGQRPNIWDEKDYNTLAGNLVRHGEFAYQPGTPASIRPPLYPAAVAAVYGLFGDENFQAVRLLQAILSLVNVVILYRIGAAAFSGATGLWLAGLYVFYPSLLGFNNLLLTEVLFTFLLCAFCGLVIRSVKRASILCLAFAGVLLGLAALSRSVVWLLPPVLAGFLLLAFPGSLTRRCLAVVALVAAFAVTIAPWAIRNTRLEKTFVAIDTMGGRNFMMGNYRHTPLFRSWTTIEIEGEKSWIHEVNQTYPPEQRATQGQIDKLALRQGLKFVAENPGLTLLRDVIKFFDFWGLERELIAGAGSGYFGDLSPPVVFLLTVLIFGSYAFALIAGVFGIVMAPPSDRRLHLFLLLVIAFICGMHTLVFAHSRYHLPVMPLVLAYAASALVHRREIWQQRRSRPFWLACGLSAVFVGAWLWSMVVVDGERFMALIRSVA